MEKFEYKSRKEQRAMSMEELAEYRCQERKYDFANNKPINGVAIKKFFNPLVKLALKLDRLLSREKLTCIKKEERPIIYVCTHIGGNDVLRIVEALKKSGYIFFGDPGPLYKDPFGNTLAVLNGTIDFELDDKEDRHIAFETGIKVLRKWGRIIIFPEGSWNPFENLPLMKLYEGAAKMAIGAPANIIPLAVEQYDDEYIFYEGDMIRVHPDMDSKMLTEIIRDTLATQRFEIWETQPKLVLPKMTNPMVWDGVSVSEKLRLQRKYDEIYRQTIIDRKPDYGTLQDVYKAMFIDPTETTADALIAEVQDRLTLIRGLELEFQKIDAQTVNLNNMIAEFKTKGDEGNSISTAFQEVEKNIAQAKEIIEYLDDDYRSKHSEEDYDFDSPTYKRISDLNRRIDIIQKEKSLFLALMPENKLAKQSANSDRRISLTNN